MRRASTVKTQHTNNWHASPRAFSDWILSTDQDPLDQLAQRTKRMVDKNCSLMQAFGRQDLVKYILSGAESKAYDGEHASKLWSVPMSLPGARAILGDYNLLPPEMKKLALECATKQETKEIAIFKERGFYVFLVCIDNYTAKLVGDYCDLYVNSLTPQSISFDFRVTMYSENIKEYPTNATIARF